MRPMALQWSPSQIPQWSRTSHCRPTILMQFVACMVITLINAQTYLSIIQLFSTFKKNLMNSSSSSDISNTIYMISSSSIPSIPSVIEDPSNISTHCFNNDEEILEALSAPEYPWDDMHNHSFFIPDEPLSSSNQYLVEAKDFIHGKVDWFKNPIPTPNAFE